MGADTSSIAAPSKCRLHLLLTCSNNMPHHSHTHQPHTPRRPPRSHGIHEISDRTLTHHALQDHSRITIKRGTPPTTEPHPPARTLPRHTTP
jgi:hypothetical protein